MGQEVHVLDLRDDAQTQGSLNPLDLAASCGSDPAAVARSFAAELIERGVDERDRFWNDWGETVITAGITWLLADRPPDERRLSSLFELFTSDDVVYSVAVMMDNKDKLQNRAARAAFNAFLQLPDQNTRPSVLGTVQTHLRLFDSDLAQADRYHQHRYRRADYRGTHVPLYHRSAAASHCLQASPCVCGSRD
jgi:type IV secretory pathway TraG/TraD family ATPase VirD4